MLNKEVSVRKWSLKSRNLLLESTGKGLEFYFKNGNCVVHRSVLESADQALRQKPRQPSGFVSSRINCGSLSLARSVAVCTSGWRIGTPVTDGGRAAYRMTDVNTGATRVVEVGG